MDSFQAHLKNLAKTCADLTPTVDQATRAWLETQWKAGSIPMLNRLRSMFDLPLFEYGGDPAIESEWGWWCDGKQILATAKTQERIVESVQDRLVPQRERLLLRNAKTGDTFDEESFKRGLEICSPATEHTFTIGESGSSWPWHRFTTYATNDDGLHTRRHIVICKTCNVLVHDGTTGPIEQARTHVQMKLEEKKP